MYYDNLMKLKDKYHPQCIFNTNSTDFKISFDENGELIGRFFCHEKFQGYPGKVHGGVLSGLIDSAMTQLLFAHKIIAYTVRLYIKYSYPVVINKEAIINARIIEIKKKIIYKTSAKISQDNKTLVTADAQFWLEKDLNKGDL